MRRHDDERRRRRRDRRVNDLAAIERAIVATARAQLGVITYAQLLEHGWSEGTLRRRVRSGWLRRLHRCVYLVGPVMAPGAEELAARLACGHRSIVSHASAAYLDGLPPHPARPKSVSVTVVGRNPGTRRRIEVHRVRSIGSDEVKRRGLILLTTAARTILDRAASLDVGQLEHLIAEAYAKRLAARPQLLTLLDRYPGRPGTPILRKLLDGGIPARTRSDPERLLLALLRKASLPAPRANAGLHGWEVDFLWSAERLIVEVDALSTHSSPRAFERDRRKDADLTLRGYTVIRVTKRQLETEPEAVIARIAAALALRGSQ